AGERRRRSRLSGATDLILGWSADGEMSHAMGFRGPSSADATSEDGREALTLEGDGHVLTVAPTGAGKGRGAIIPNLLRYEGPAIVVDPKGENYHVTARARREMGHDVRVIDPFALVSDRTDQLNPLDVLERPGVELESEAQALALMLAGSGRSLNEPFWDIWGRSLLAGVIAYVAEQEEPEERHFGRVRELVKNDDVVYSLAQALDQAPDLEGIARTEIASFLQLVEQTRSGVLATAQSYTEVVNSAPARRTLSRTTIDLDAVADGSPVTIYLVLPPDKLASHGPLLRLWIGSLLKTVMSRAVRPERDTLFLIDECAQLGALEHLRVAMTLLRGYGLKVWAFFQDLSQLRRLYPDDWQTIVNNAAVFQTFGLTNHVMAREAADLIGDYDAFTLRAMAKDRQVLAAAREKARMCALPDYLSDPEFAGRFDANPFFARRAQMAARAG
ncbi:MAG: type IV secretory system conjugative DNA transfer family protein, partial [Caulobacterales bacterium]|nr:type IV secretory system conjugative DNA transfer family protein [Caulobacterales bacterium]